MHTSDLWKHVQRVQQELRHGSFDSQDEAMNTLHIHLDEPCVALFPSFVYPHLVEVLRFYCREMLPRLIMSSDEERQDIRASIERTINRLKNQESLAKDLEARFKQMFLQVRSGMVKSVEDVVTALHTIVVSQSDEIAASDTIRYNKKLEKQYRDLKRSPFTSSNVMPFFEVLISTTLPEEVKEQFEYVKLLFWDQLNDLLQMKAVLVNTLNKKALITRLDVETALQPLGLDELEFENTVDDSMYLSCWKAVQAARAFLEKQFPGILNDQSLHVTCRFPNPAAEYNDASASLLVGLKVVSDVLDMEIDPQVVVSGEVDDAGRILPVDHVAEKLEAAEQHPAIQQLYLPQDGTYVASKQVAIFTVHTFSGAIQGYYGDQLPKNRHLPIGRRQLVKGIIAVFTVPLGLFTFKNIFTHPVTEQDLWNVEYAKELYQKSGDFQKAQDILQFILKKFVRHQTSAEPLQIQAEVLKHLGVISKQQHYLQHGILQLQRALSILRSLHNNESQAHILIEIADAYYHSVAEDGIDSNSNITLRYLNWANEMITPAMQTYYQLKCNYYGAMGSLYSELDEYERAKVSMEKSLEYDDDTSWSYHLSKQCLGRILVRLGEYEEAFDLLDSSLHVPVLQRPYNQVRAFRGLSDLFLSIGDEQEGLQFAEKAVTLCKEYGLKTQQLALQKMLARHNFPNTIIYSF